MKALLTRLLPYKSSHITATHSFRILYFCSKILHWWIISMKYSNCSPSYFWKKTCPYNCENLSNKFQYFCQILCRKSSWLADWVPWIFDFEAPKRRSHLYSNPYNDRCLRIHGPGKYRSNLSIEMVFFWITYEWLVWWYKYLVEKIWHIYFCFSTKNISKNVKL